MREHDAMTVGDFLVQEPCYLPSEWEGHDDDARRAISLVTLRWRQIKQDNEPVWLQPLSDKLPADIVTKEYMILRRGMMIYSEPGTILEFLGTINGGYSVRTWHSQNSNIPVKGDVYTTSDSYRGMAGVRTVSASVTRMPRVVYDFVCEEVITFVGFCDIKSIIGRNLVK
jgi:hypothetical protein